MNIKEWDVLIDKEYENTKNTKSPEKMGAKKEHQLHE